jgi:hypothetical protein
MAVSQAFRLGRRADAEYITGHSSTISHVFQVSLPAPEAAHGRTNPFRPCSTTRAEA